MCAYAEFERQFNNWESAHFKVKTLPIKFVVSQSHRFAKYITDILLGESKRKVSLHLSTTDCTQNEPKK